MQDVANTRKSAALACALLLALSACASPTLGWSGLDVSSGQNRSILPRSGRFEFAGVYRSPQLGRLQLWQRGSHVQGRFDYTRGAACVVGVLEGTLEGNWLRFAWQETHRFPTRLTRQRGGGEFFYDAPLGDQTRPRLFGRRDYRSRLSAPQKNFVQVLRVDGGPITAVRSATNPSQRPPACAATCSC
jgi:hypothetical protein